MFSEANQLVILTDNLGCAFGKVQGKGGLVGSEVIDVEDEFFREEFCRAPNTPAHARIYLMGNQQAMSIPHDHANTDQTILVPRDIDRYYFLEAKVPDEVWDDKRSNKPAARRVDVDGTVNLFLHQQVVDGLDIFILPRVGCSEDRTNAAKRIRSEKNPKIMQSYIVFSSTKSTASFGSIT